MKINKKLAAVSIVSLFVGVGAGSVANTPEPVAAPAPTVTVTAPAPKPSTPQVCLTALDRADTTLKLAGEGFDLTSRGIDAMAEFDYKTVEKITGQMNDKSAEMLSAMDRYVLTRDQCRAAK